MVGRLGVARSALAPEGQVMIDGELWRAVSQDGPVAAGEPVKVAAIDGLTLKVTRSAQRP
jgi:membrane-bound serine protease (ClpP class)